MIDTLTIEPPAEGMMPFAKWAIKHNINTVSADSFGVPVHLFSSIPEDLLVGAIVNDQPYVPASPSTKE